MTTVAYRDGVLAADTLTTSGQSHRAGSVVKAFRVGGLLVAWAGALPKGQGFVDWLRCGAVGEPPDLGADSGAAEALIVMPDDLLLRATQFGWERWRAPYTTIGTGSDYAEGAMAFGATSPEAVAAALAHECLSGGEITVLRR